jgi:hypothetical protein
LNGSGLSSTDRTTVNSAEFAPIPSAITSTAEIANPGVRTSVRTAYFRSRQQSSAKFNVLPSHSLSRTRRGLPNFT